MEDNADIRAPIDDQPAAADDVVGPGHLNANDHDVDVPPPDHQPTAVAPVPPGPAVNAIADGLAGGTHHATAVVTPAVFFSSGVLF